MAVISRLFYTKHLFVEFVKFMKFPNVQKSLVLMLASFALPINKNDDV